MNPATSGPDDVVASCDEAPNGTECGEPGAKMHCIFDACVKNACGDGLVAFGEECDDGDEVDGNGCNARCVVEACGNGRKDVGEECDDGNAADNDSCSAQCRRVMTGPGDGGSDAGTGMNPSCPSVAQLTATPAESLINGSPIALSGADSQGATHLWYVAEGNAQGIFATPAAATSAFTCKGVAGPKTLRRLSSKSGCQAVIAEVSVNCLEGDAGVDSGVDPVVDSGVDPGTDSGMDAAPGSDASPGTDSGVDSGAGDSATPDAGSNGGDGGVSKACQDCMQASCVDFNGLLLADQCFKNDPNGVVAPLPQPATTQACIDAVSCSIGATNGCADDTGGPARCYCGNQTDTACAQNGPITSGPDRGPCIQPWVVATGCAEITDPVARNSCVASRFQDLSTAAGYAYFTIECANFACFSECGLTQ